MALDSPNTWTKRLCSAAWQNKTLTETRSLSRRLANPKAYLWCSIALFLGTLGFWVIFSTNTAKYGGSGADGAPKYQSSFAGHSAKPPLHRRKAVVIASYSKQDVSWLSLIPQDWEINRVMLDDPAPSPPNNLTVPRNQGREAMAYLTYIIENYETFPDFAVFVHGHWRAWHQQETISSKIKALNLTALAQEDYISLRCNPSPGDCDPDNVPSNTVALIHLSQFWRTMFPPPTPETNHLIDNHDPRQTGVLPESIKAKCCGQFAVSRKGVQDMPLESWIRVRSPIVRDIHDYTWGQDLDSGLIGMTYEPLWHLFFGKNAQYCPDPEYCRQVHFSNAITCNKYISFGGVIEDAHCTTIFDDEEDT